MLEALSFPFRDSPPRKVRSHVGTIAQHGSGVTDMRPTRETHETLRTLRAALGEVLGDALTSCFVVGSTVLPGDGAVDLDTVAILDDQVSTLDFVTLVAPLLHRQSKASRVFVTCFPLQRATFLNGMSQFVKNVREHGVEV